MSDIDLSTALILLEEKKEVHPEKILEELSSFLGRQKVSDLSTSDNGFLITIDKSRILAALHDYPFSSDLIRDSISISDTWDGDEGLVLSHQAHMPIIFQAKNISKIENRILLTKVVAALAQAHSALAIIWNASGNLCNVSDFCEHARQTGTDYFPLDIWINFYMWRNEDDSLSLITTGLTEFGLPEIEVVESKADSEIIYHAASGVAWLLLSGEPIKHGDTIGPDDATLIQVSIGESVYREEEETIKLVL